MQLRDYQIPAVDAIVAVTRGIVKAPAGSGKTVIAAAAINRWTGRNMPTPTVIWYAHTTDQCDQARKACDAMGLVDIQIDIVCYQSGKSAEGYTIAILDECHHIASPEFRKVLEGYTGIRWGFSATPDRADELMDDVYTLIGPIVYEVPRDILVEAGNLAPAKVYFHAPNERDSLAEPIESDAQLRAEKMEYAVNHTAMKLLTQPMDRVLTMSGQAPLVLQLEQNGVETSLPMKTWRDLAKQNAKQLAIFNEVIKTAARKELLSRARWLACQELGVFVNEERNWKIAETANLHMACGDSVLVLVGSIEHGKLLQSKIDGSLVLHSKMGAKRRREAMEALRSGTLRCGIATSLADEGLDIPRLNTLILAAAGRSESKAEQRTGRVLRSFLEKTHGTIHDFWDWQHPLLLAQARARAKVYAGLKYEFVGVAEILPTVLKAVGITLHPAIGMLPKKKIAKTSKNQVASTSALDEVASTLTPPVNTNTDANELLPNPATERLDEPASPATEPAAPTDTAAPVPAGVPLAHATRTHARFSPSSLKGRLICPGFISDPDGDKKYADRGSLGHEAVEKDDLSLCGDDVQLKEAAETCINYKKRVCAGKEVHQELKLYICDVAGDPQYGHTDLVAIEPSGKKADMIDWKFAYNAYEADGPQFWSYTLGVFNRWPSA
jgi:superfamily II DNA or RNA helicase